MLPARANFRPALIYFSFACPLRCIRRLPAHICAARLRSRIRFAGICRHFIILLPGWRFVFRHLPFIRRAAARRPAAPPPLQRRRSPGLSVGIGFRAGPAGHRRRRAPGRPGTAPGRWPRAGRRHFWLPLFSTPRRSGRFAAGPSPSPARFDAFATHFQHSR